MKKLHKDRLLKLAEHLERGKLGHKVFDFSRVNGFVNCNPSRKACGTNGCAMGELPVVFPKSFKFGDTIGCETEVVDVNGWDVHDAVDPFFGLGSEESGHLFYPNEQKPKLFGGRKLGPKATRKQVAANIRDFIKHKEKQATMT
jgi:hypothetical protein